MLDPSFDNHPIRPKFLKELKMPKTSKFVATMRKKLFAEHYIKTHFNARKAARLAGYGGNDKTISNQANDLLKDPEVQDYISKIVLDVGIDSKEVAGRLASIARGDMGLFLDPKTHRLDLSRAREAHQLHLIKNMKRRTKIRKQRD